MILNELLEEYEKVTSECRELLETEIAALKQGRQDENESVLDEKRGLIDKMSELLDQLRKFNSHRKEPTTLEQDQINFLQQRFMLILKLDRELEKLLLSKNLPNTGTVSPLLDGSIHLAQLYKKASGSKSRVS